MERPRSKPQPVRRILQPRDGGPDVFVHHSEIKADGFRTLNEGDRVSFEVVDSPKGPRAANVNKI